MALNDNDLLLINDSQDSNEAKKIKYSTLKSNINGDSGNDLQQVTDNGNTTDNLIETSGGVKISGGTSAGVEAGLSSDAANSFLALSANSAQAIRISSVGSVHIGTGAGNSSDKVRANNNSSASASVTCYKGVSTGNAGNTNIDGFAHYLNSSEDHTNVRGFHAIVQNLTGTVDNSYGFQVESAFGDTNKAATNNYGFYSQVQETSSGENFNFYAASDTPNFFNGDTYIGGTTTRNTRQLWESTLTEEQKEELAAGTLAIPANVSTPGDGSFVRQWWYDQQSAEDQALIDAGELEYPEHFQAANFADTFALGDNNNITLKRSGLGEFKGGVKVAGGNEANVECGIIAEGNYRLKFVTNYKNYLDINRYGNILSNADIDQETSANYVTFNSNPALTTQRTAGQTLEVSNFKAGLQSFDNPNGAKIQYKAFWVENPNANIDDGDATEVYGFYSRVANQMAAGQLSYNFYAAGLAPNYFAGNITCDGKINGTFNLRMESDDPNAYQTTYSTDEEGNQVEKSTYLGTTEDLLSIIKDLRTRIAALEANEVVDDATDSALLTLVANLSARVLTLEGGNN